MLRLKSGEHAEHGGNADVSMFYPSRSFCVRRKPISFRASLGRQKLLISSSRRARALLSTRAKLSRSKKGSKGPKTSRVVPSSSPSSWEYPCRATDIVSEHGLQSSCIANSTFEKSCSRGWVRLWTEILSSSVSLWMWFVLLVKPESIYFVCSDPLMC